MSAIFIKRPKELCRANNYIGLVLFIAALKAFVTCFVSYFNVNMAKCCVFSYVDSGE